MFFSVFAVALLAEGVDRNRIYRMTRPTDGKVALLAEGVDRNPSGHPSWRCSGVALLAEGVDRNL